MDFSWQQGLLFAQEGVGIFGSMLFPLVLTFLAFYLLLIVPERKRTKQRDEMVAALKKNDKVMTSFGLYGVVANVKPEEGYVILLVDEERGVRLKFHCSVIAQVIDAKERTAETPKESGQ